MSLCHRLQNNRSWDPLDKGLGWSQARWRLWGRHWSPTVRSCSSKLYDYTIWASLFGTTATWDEETCLTDSANQHTCMYVCMPFFEEVCTSTHGDRHQQALLSPSANQIPSEVVVSSDASLTLKGLSFSVSLTPLVFYMYHLSVLCSVTCSWIL